MSSAQVTPPVVVSVIIPANNEQALIGDCLLAVCASDWTLPGQVEVIVVANGCQDDTVQAARSHIPAFAERGWLLHVLDLAEGGKLRALNAGDAQALGPNRVYLDADVTVSPGLLQALVQHLDGEGPRYASGTLEISARSWISRAYARIWRNVPFMRAGVPGCGVFAVNAAGRDRWGTFPQIISDDMFVRLSFAPSERQAVAPHYVWPIAEGFANLVKVRRRQDAGVEELADLYPDLQANEDKAPFPASQKLRMALRDPVGFAVYTSVALVVRLTRSRQSGWSRGR